MCQSETTEVLEMRVVHQFEKSNSLLALQIRSMIEELKHYVALLEAEIDAIEAFERRVDPTNFAYPIAARTMKARRDNLVLTISTLGRRLNAPILRSD